MRFFILAVLACGVSAAPAEVSLTGRWTIVQHDYPQALNGLNYGVREPARVLAEALKESLDVDARIVGDTRPPPKGPGRRIFIGEPFAEAAGLMPEDFKGWDWGIAEKDGDLYFFGHDRPGSAPTVPTACVVPSALATVRFMRDQMGVLFLMPGRIGREIPRLGRLNIPSGFFRRGTAPIAFSTGRLYDYPYDLASASYGCGTFFTYGGHTYPVACPLEKYRKTHPEYFARNEKGEVLWDEKYQAYCNSNPDFRKLVHDELLRRFDAGADVVELGQNDGNPGQCRCPGCKALYGTDDWGEKLWCFHRDLAEQIRKERPGKIVQIVSYSATSKPPKSFRVFPANVMVECCRESEEDLALWQGYTVPQGFTYYTYNWSGYLVSGYTPHRSVQGLVRQLQRFRRLGFKGLYRCGYGEMFGMEGPTYWVYNHLVEDEKTDVPSCLATYYRGAFGPAADAMKRFYEDLEQPLAEVENRSSIDAENLVETTIRRTEARDPIGLLAHVYTPERVARMDAALAAAEATKGLNPKQVRRLQLVRTEWTYVRNIGTIASLYRAFCIRPTLAGRDAIFEKLAERKAIVADLYPDGKKMRKMKDWPEIRLFDEAPLAQFLQNGRLQAPIHEPLTWDVERMKKYRIVPCEVMTPAERKAELAATPGMRPIRNFVLQERPAKGATLTPYPDGTGFVLSQGPSNGLVRARARLTAKDGMKPNTIYRVSWLCRWKDVKVPNPREGLRFAVEYDHHKELREPSGLPHQGTSKEWVRESVVFTSSALPDFTYGFTFRFVNSTGGLAEVRDVAIEELDFNKPQ